MNNTASIKNWEIVKTSKNMHLKGRIYGDSTKEYADGELIISAPILDGGGGFITTLDTVFKLEN